MFLACLRGLKDPSGMGQNTTSASYSKFLTLTQQYLSTWQIGISGCIFACEIYGMFVHVQDRLPAPCTEHLKHIQNTLCNDMRTHMHLHNHPHINSTVYTNVEFLGRSPNRHEDQIPSLRQRYGCTQQLQRCRISKVPISKFASEGYHKIP